MAKQELVFSAKLEKEIKARLEYARDKCGWTREDMVDEFTAMIGDVLGEEDD